MDSLEIILPEEKHLKEISDSLTKANSCLIRIGTIFSMAVMPVDHPLSRKMALSIHDLEGVSYIPSGEKFDFEIGELFDTVRITPTVSFKLTDELVSHKLIEAGFGVSVSTQYLLDATMAFSNICIRPFKEHYYRTLVIAKNDLRFCPAAAITFLTFLKEQLGLEP